MLGVVSRWKTFLWRLLSVSAADLPAG
jgi:hypothetical protein